MRGVLYARRVSYIASRALVFSHKERIDRVLKVCFNDRIFFLTFPNMPQSKKLSPFAIAAGAFHTKENADPVKSFTITFSGDKPGKWIHGSKTVKAVSNHLARAKVRASLAGRGFRVYIMHTYE